MLQGAVRAAYTRHLHELLYLFVTEQRLVGFGFNFVPRHGTGHTCNTNIMEFEKCHSYLKCYRNISFF